VIDWIGIVEKIRPLPWRLWAIIVSVNFITASIVSLAILALTMPDGNKRKLSTARESQQNNNLTLSGTSLDQAALDRILARNIFNSAGEKEGPNVKTGQQNAAAEIVKTDMPVKLRGVIYGGDPFSGIAVVENTGTPSPVTNSFMVGDQLDKDAVVKEIHEEKVIIERAGRREFIPLETPELLRSQRRRGRAKPVGDSPDAGARPLATEPPPEVFKEEGFSRTGGDIEISALKKNALITSELPTVLQDAKAEPNVVDGQIMGWRLERIRKGSIYEKSGFQNGDVIEEINGVPLNDAAQAIKLLQGLRNEPEIDIRFSRSGARRTANIKVK
jgi:type II secretion system protein C